MSLLLLFSAPSGQGSSVTGIPSAEAFGALTLAGGSVSLALTGMASNEAFGALTLAGGSVSLALTGIASNEAFGPLATAAAVSLALTGIASSEAFGPLSWTSTRALALSGIASAESFGLPATTPNTASLALSGLSSGEAFGVASFSATRDLAPLGISSGERLGLLSTSAACLVPLSGISSGEAFGLPDWSPATTVSLSGLPSLEAFGLAEIDNDGHQIAWKGIPSAEKFGKTRLKLILSKRVTTFPNGQILTSLALTPQAISTFWQQLTCAMLGIDTATDELCYSKVRLDWPSGGQPAWKITDDITFLKVTEEDDAYNRLRDRRYHPNGSTTILSEDIFTRVWRVSWSCYGPNSFDQARLIKSALLSLDFVTEQMSEVSLYLVTDLPATTRAPEKFQGQWWERTDLSIRVNEQVEETLTIGTIGSAEVILENESGVVADITAP